MSFRNKKMCMLRISVIAYCTYDISRLFHFSFISCIISRIECKVEDI